MYFIGVTFTTVGYGDYTAGTTAEYLICMVFQFTGLLFFSFMMNLITLLSKTDFKWEEFAEKEHR
jgi:hypothetical protein